jgi:selenocysteine-specific elongation factor
MAKLVVLEGAAITPRSAGWAQLVLASPVLAMRGDRFILRDETARWTLGGGEVVNPFADRHRRNDPALPARLAVLQGGATAEAAEALLEMVPDFATDRATVAQALNLREEEALRALGEARAAIPIPDAGGAEGYTTAAKWERLARVARELVEAAHRAQPLAPGLEMESLRTQLPWNVPQKVFRWCVERLVAAGGIVREESLVRATAHRVALAAPGRALGERIERLLAAGRFTPPDLRQLEEETRTERRELLPVLGVLESEGKVVRVAPDLYYARTAADEVLGLVRAHCQERGELTAAALRDLIQASRKYAIALLEWCDRTAVTVRVGDVRKLRR